MDGPSPSSFRSRTRIDSFRYAFSGFKYALTTQINLRIHLVITLCIVGLGVYVRLKPLEWGIILLAIGLVLGTELINTAIEAGIDLASPQIHPLAKTGKDVAAAAVLMSVILAIMIGILILGPPLWHKWKPTLPS